MYIFNRKVDFLLWKMRQLVLPVFSSLTPSVCCSVFPLSEIITLSTLPASGPQLRHGFYMSEGSVLTAGLLSFHARGQDFLLSGFYWKGWRVLYFWTHSCWRMSACCLYTWKIPWLGLLFLVHTHSLGSFLFHRLMVLTWLWRVLRPHLLPPSIQGKFFDSYFWLFSLLDLLDFLFWEASYGLFHHLCLRIHHISFECVRWCFSIFSCVYWSDLRVFLAVYSV